ncbi:MAG: hypothetical protein AB1418_02210 [Pseudomonadota bacterium]
MMLTPLIVPLIVLGIGRNAFLNRRELATAQVGVAKSKTVPVVVPSRARGSGNQTMLTLYCLGCASQERGGGRILDGIS